VDDLLLMVLISWAIAMVEKVLLEGIPLTNNILCSVAMPWMLTSINLNTYVDFPRNHA